MLETLIYVLFRLGIGLMRRKASTIMVTVGSMRCCKRACTPARSVVNKSLRHPGVRSGDDRDLTLHGRDLDALLIAIQLRPVIGAEIQFDIFQALHGIREAIVFQRLSDLFAAH